MPSCTRAGAASTASVMYTTVVGSGNPKNRHPNAVIISSRKTLLPERVTSRSEILKVKPER